MPEALTSARGLAEAAAWARALRLVPRGRLGWAGPCPLCGGTADSTRLTVRAGRWGALVTCWTCMAAGTPDWDARARRAAGLPPAPRP